VSAQESLRWYLVRHGVTAWNREMRMQGHSDVPLDAEGMEQAKLIGERLASGSRPPLAVWSSDLVRARVTAEAIASRLNLRVRTTPLLRETMLGDWEGLTRAEIIARGDAERLKLYHTDSLHHRPPGAEPLETAWDRMIEAAELIRAEHPRGQVAIVGHGGTLRVLICDVLGAPIANMGRMWLDNVSLSILDDYGAEGRNSGRVMLVNDTGHLTVKAR